jgi:hypothetical protein
MRTFILILTIIPLLLQGQHTCGTSSPTEAEKRDMRVALQMLQSMKVLNTGTTCVPIAIHDVLDGSNGGAVNRLALNRAIANLNHYFLDAGIEFYVCSISTLNSAVFFDHDKTTEQALLLSTKLPATNAMNLYLVNSVNTSSGLVAGYAAYPYNSVNSTVSVIDKGVLDFYPNGTVVHEYGHHFNLFHTHEGTSNGNADPAAENVPRSGINANCNTKGDELCDTPADPEGTYDFNSCTYTGITTDINGVPYAPDIDNIMSYYPDECGGKFTSNQLSRMASALTVRQGHSAYTLSCGATAVSAATGLSAIQNGNQVDLTWVDNANNEFGYLIERSETSNNSGFRCLKNGGVDANSNSFVDVDIVSNTTYYYRIKASNGNCDSYSAVATVSVGLVYCVPSYSNGCNNASIANVTLTGNTVINNSTGCTNEYVDYSALSASVTAGGTYLLSITKSAANTRYLYAYGDFNQDGDFDDASELLVNGASINYSGNITIPAGAFNGNTRLRIIMSNSSSNTSACNTGLIFGETEDYSLLVSGGVTSNQESLGYELNMQIIPNPTNGKTLISYPSTQQGIAEITLYSIEGIKREVVEIKSFVGNNTHELDLSEVKPGVYWLEIRMGDKVFKNKLIKQ